MRLCLLLLDLNIVGIKFRQLSYFLFDHLTRHSGWLGYRDWLGYTYTLDGFSPLYSCRHVFGRFVFYRLVLDFLEGDPIPDVSAVDQLKRTDRMQGIVLNCLLLVRLSDS